MMKQRWGPDRNVLRPTPGDPWGVEQHHWNTGAEENQQLNPGGPSNRQKSSGPKPHQWPCNHPAMKARGNTAIPVLCAGAILQIIFFSISLANYFLLTIVMWPLVGIIAQAQISHKKKYLEPIFLLIDRRNHNFETVLLSVSYYQFSYTKQVIFLYSKIWVGCLNIKSGTIFPVFNGLLTARVFRKHAYNIISSNTFMPGLYIRTRTMILTLLKKWNRPRNRQFTFRSADMTFRRDPYLILSCILWYSVKG